MSFLRSRMSLKVANGTSRFFSAMLRDAMTRCQFNKNTPRFAASAFTSFHIAYYATYRISGNHRCDLYPRPGSLATGRRSLHLSPGNGDNECCNYASSRLRSVFCNSWLPLVRLVSRMSYDGVESRPREVVRPPHVSEPPL
jgi:hypothetical protein